MAPGGPETLSQHFLQEGESVSEGKPQVTPDDDALCEGSRLLADPNVRAFIDEVAAERNKRLEIEAQDVLVKLQRMLNTDIALLYMRM